MCACWYVNTLGNGSFTGNAMAEFFMRSCPRLSDRLRCLLACVCVCVCVLICVSCISEPHHTQDVCVYHVYPSCTIHNALPHQSSIKCMRSLKLRFHAAIRMCVRVCTMYTRATQIVLKMHALTQNPACSYTVHSTVPS
jgi:hypothetical protein